jgi:hypothetical protein
MNKEEKEERETERDRERKRERERERERERRRERRSYEPVVGGSGVAVPILGILDLSRWTWLHRIRSPAFLRTIDSHPIQLDGNDPQVLRLSECVHIRPLQRQADVPRHLTALNTKIEMNLHKRRLISQI